MTLNPIALGLPVPLLAAGAFSVPLLAHFIGERRILIPLYSLAFSIAALICSVLVLLDVASSGPIVYAFGGWPPPIGIVYEADMVSALLGFITSLVMTCIIAYSIWYPEIDKPSYYYALVLGMEAGILGCMYTGDLFNFFVMLEVTSASAYALVAFLRTRRSVVASAKYAFMGAVATTLYFLAVVLIYAATGTVNTADASLRLHGHAGILGVRVFYADPIVAGTASLALALWALCFKSAIFPNHFWLPDAHPEAPTPVSAALSGLVVNVGVYGIARIFYTVAGPNSILGYESSTLLLVLGILGAVSAMVGSLAMIVQEDVKRLLAYSTIGHMGLVAMGLSLASSLQASIAGVTASIYHLLNHSVGKALLFMASGLLIEYAGSRRISDLRGLAYHDPVLAVLVVIGLLHLMGVPILGGFFSKLALFTAMVEAGYLWEAIILVVSSAIAAIAYMKLIVILFSREGAKQVKSSSGRLRLVALVSMSILAALAILLGVLSPLFTALSRIGAQQMVIATSYQRAALATYTALVRG